MTDNGSKNLHLSGPSRPHWTVDRRVPVAMVLAIVVQTIGVVGGGVWYVSGLDNRVTVVEGSAARNAERVAGIAARTRAAENLTTRLDERLESQGRSLRRIERLLREIASDAHDSRRERRGRSYEPGEYGPETFPPQ